MPISYGLHSLQTWQQAVVRIAWNGDVESITHTTVQLAYSEPLAVIDCRKANSKQWSIDSSFTTLTEYRNALEVS